MARIWSAVAAELLCAVLLLVGQWTFVYGAAWDIQWHLQVGRDRPLTPPHLVLLGGIALTGAVALIAIPAFTIAARRGADGPARQHGWWRLGPVAAPPGLSLAGAGALLSALAFPLDNYWHGIYGLDVTIWAPFHVMILSGMALAALGTTYAFAALARERLVAQAGLAMALASLSATLLVLSTQSLDRQGVFRLDGQAVLAYPLLVALITIPWLVAAAPALRRPGGATLVALSLVALRWVLEASVPWAVSVTAAAEGLAVSRSAPAFVATALAIPAWAIAAGLLVDLTWFLSRALRRAPSAGLPWLSPWLSLLLSGTLAGLLLGWLDRPWQQTIPLTRLGPDVALGAAFTSTIPLLALSALAGALVGVGLGAALRRAQP